MTLEEENVFQNPAAFAVPKVFCYFIDSFVYFIKIIRIVRNILTSWVYWALLVTILILLHRLLMIFLVSSL